MDRQLADNWNSVVSEKDTVFVLGDFSCYGEERDREILNRLRGRKVLVKGNHDRHRSGEEWRRLGFAECVEWPVVYEDFFILSHEPVYLNENMPYANFSGMYTITPPIGQFRDRAIVSVRKESGLRLFCLKRSAKE